MVLPMGRGAAEATNGLGNNEGRADRRAILGTTDGIAEALLGGDNKADGFTLNKESLVGEAESLDCKGNLLGNDDGVTD